MEDSLIIPNRAGISQNVNMIELSDVAHGRLNHASCARHRSSCAACAIFASRCLCRAPLLLLATPYEVYTCQRVVWLDGDSISSLPQFGRKHTRALQQVERQVLQPAISPPGWERGIASLVNTSGRKRDGRLLSMVQEGVKRAPTIPDRVTNSAVPCF